MVTTRPFLYHKIHNGIAMAEVEHPEKHGWWLNELESLWELIQEKRAN
jgi:hypothetical protein